MDIQIGMTSDTSSTRDQIYIFSLKPKKILKQQSSSSMIKIQWAVWNATPEHTGTLKTYDCPIFIKQKNQRKKKTPYRLALNMNTREQNIT
jgi:hypothetical protein